MVAKNPEWLSVLDMTAENSGKSEAELERAKAAVMNQAMNQFVISRGYPVKYDQEGNAILPITTIVTKISDPNTPMYMSATGDQFVIAEDYVLSMTKEQALNGIGHEYGHYSKADDIATRDQTVANHTGKRVEELTKNLSSKPVSEATWKNLVNTSSVITGPGADVIANRIPVGEREYYSTEIFTSETYSFGGRVSRTQSAFTLVNDKSKTLTTYNIGSTSVGFGLLDIGGSAGVGFYTDETVEDLSKLTISVGGSIAVAGYGIGTDLLFKKSSYIPRGVRIYGGKGMSSPIPFDVHVTFIEIGNPKNIKKDRKAYDVYKRFMEKSRETGGEW